MKAEILDYTKVLSAADNLKLPETNTLIISA